jgi:hypothetical protein
MVLYGQASGPVPPVPVSVLNSKLELIDNVSDFPSVTFDRFDFLENYIKPASFFRLPVTEEEVHNRINVKIYNTGYDWKDNEIGRSGRNRLPRELIGSVSRAITPNSKTEPLNPEALELSDLVLCMDVDTTAGVESEIGGSTEQEMNGFVFPCHVPYELKIPGTHDLNLLFEIYNLHTNDLNRSHFMITYRIESEEKSRNLFSRLFGKEQSSTSITLDYEIEGDRLREHLKIDVSGHETGVHELSIEIKDVQSGETVSRSGKFEIVAPDGG